MTDSRKIAGLPPTLFGACSLLFLATAFAGWQIGGSGTDENPEAAPASGHDAKRALRPTSGRSRFGTPPHASSAVSGIAAIKDPRERLRATIALVGSIPIEELSDWLEQRWFEQRGFELTLFNKLAKERWQDEDPEGFLAWAAEEDSGSFQSLLASWSASDPQRVIDYYRNDPDAQTYQVVNSITEIARNDPQAALAGLRELRESGRVSEDIQHYTNDLFEELAKNSPELLKGSIDSLDDQLRSQAEAALFRQDLRNDFSSAVADMSERTDGWNLFSNGLRQDPSLVAKALEDLDRLPEAWLAELRQSPNHLMRPESAEQWFELDLAGLGFSDDQAKRARSYAIQYVQSSDPARALELLQEGDFDDETRTRQIQGMFQSYSHDPEMSESLMASLNSESDRKIARSVAETAQESFNTQPTQPQTAASWIAQAREGETENSGRLGYAIQSMSPQELATLNTEFQRMSTEDKDNVARAMASALRYNSNQAHEITGAAISHLVEHPIAEDELGNDPFLQHMNIDHLASTHAARLTAENPDRARQWVETLPAGEARTWAMRNVALTWSQYDPTSTRQWLRQLPEDTRSDLQSFLENPSSRPDE